MFQNIIGHTKEIEHLKEIKNSNHLSHAYLLYGPQSVGKKTIALEFLKFINNTENLSPDFLYLLSADDFSSDIISIEAIRNIRNFLSLKGDNFYKFVVIDDAERMKIETANALLKILEEPPEKSILILLTSKVGLILPTIVSRCQLIRFSPSTKQEILDFFKDRWQREKKLSEIADIAYCRPGLLSALNSDEKLWQDFVKIAGLYDKFKFGKLLDFFLEIKKLLEDDDLNKPFLMEILLFLCRYHMKQNPGVYFQLKPLFDTIYLYFKIPNLNFDLLLHTLVLHNMKP